MKYSDNKAFDRDVCSVIYRYDGIKASEIAKVLNTDRKTVNSALFSSPLLHELCYRDANYKWYSVLSGNGDHEGLREFAGYYSTVREFVASDEEKWLEELKNGCARIGRNLNDTRGLFHSFLDCRQTMLNLFCDLSAMTNREYLDWEIAFELRINKGRMLRIYTDVLLITGSYVFSMEFKMNKCVIEEEEKQAVKYAPFLDVIFGGYSSIVPVLVLTRTTDLFETRYIGAPESRLMICSGDMLFNVLDDKYHFLGE